MAVATLALAAKAKIATDNYGRQNGYEGKVATAITANARNCHVNVGRLKDETLIDGCSLRSVDARSCHRMTRLCTFALVSVGNTI